MYSSQQTAYPTLQPPYPTQQVPYPTQQPSYPTQQPPYPTQQPSYPTQQPPYCVPPSYDEAIGSKSYQAPSQAPYQVFPPEHTITVCSLHQNSQQPCDCCPHNPPPRQYPIVIQQDFITPTQNTHRCVRIFFIILVLIFFCIFIGVLIRIAVNINRHFD